LGDEVSGEIGRSEGLAKDLTELRAGLSPPPERLAAAPLLADYVFLLHPTIVCMGRVSGYPGSPHISLMHTSEVIVDGSSQGWLRTRSRYYRLGRRSSTTAGSPVQRSAQDDADYSP